MDQQLSAGSIFNIFNGELTDEPVVLQYLGNKQTNGNRYRLCLSDGESSTSYAVMSQQNNHLLIDGALSTFAICRISKYTLAKGKTASFPVMVVISLEVMIPGEEVGRQLGNPKVYEPRVRNPEPSKEILDEQNTEMPSRAPVSENNITKASQARESENIATVPIASQVPESDNVATVPIASLSPYYGRWTIKARVTSKTDIRHWNNAKGEGKVFSFELLDESAEIRCTAFKEQCDNFYDLIEVGRIYYITKCYVKPANKRFTNIKHEFELVFNSDTIILSCNEDSTIPVLQFNFFPIETIEAKETDSVIDVLAIVMSVGDVVDLKAKATGRDLKKRDIQLVDDSNTMVILTLWGTQAEQFNVSNNSVIAIKAVKISEFNGGKSLSGLSSTIIQVNPSLAEAERLIEWFQESGQARNAKLLSSPNASLSSANCPWLTIRQAKDLNLGSPGNSNMYMTKATVSLISDKNCIYKSCPSEGCKKKLSDLMNGMYMCEKCQTGFPNFIYRMIVQATIFDWTGEQRVTAFGDEAQKIIGMNAQELGQLQETLTTDSYQQILHNSALKSFIFKIRMKQDTFNDQTRMKAVVCNVTPVDEKQYGLFLVNAIKALIMNENPS